MKNLLPRAIVALFAAITVHLCIVPSFADDANSSTNREPHFVSKIPWAIGFGMEGTVKNVVSVEGHVQFQMNGRFWFAQYPPDSTRQAVIEVHRKDGFPATVTPDSFVAMTTNGRAGSVQNDKGRLLKILERAAERGTEVKFSLTQPKIDFGTNGFALLDAKVWQITDADLH